MNVNVYHHAFPDPDPAKRVLVATVEAPGDLAAALEYAYRWTQNIDGSWSMGPEVDGEANPDHNPAVTRHAPLHVAGGRTYGLRSSMMGDVFEVDGVRYVCATVGFKRVQA